MRYLTRRIRTGEWLTRDLPLADVERTRTLSGPSIIKGKINPELRDLVHSDGMRLLEEWATMVYAVDDDTGHLRLGGIIVPSTEYDESETTLICMGVAGYPQGFIYEDSRLWGPSTTLPRPDPIQIYRDLWDYVQSFPNSNLGVTVTGTRKSDERVGDNAEPYRLRWWESPDVGEEMNELAESTPFDYIEKYGWANTDHTEVTHQVEIGWPRLGTARDDLRFALGENIIESTVLKSPEAFANNIIGIGNGQGSTMVTARASVNDGRFRRTAVFTDKTIRSKDRLDRKVARLLNRDLRGGRVEIDQIVVCDHPNAPIAAVRPGDDILVSTYVPAYGGVEQWGRVVGITQGEDDNIATFTLIPSDKFQYSAGREEEEADPYVPSIPVLPQMIGTPYDAYVQTGLLTSVTIPVGTQEGDLIVIGIKAGPSTVTDGTFTHVAEVSMASDGSTVGTVLMRVADAHDSGRVVPIAMGESPGWWKQVGVFTFRGTNGPLRFTDKVITQAVQSGTGGTLPGMDASGGAGTGMLIYFGTDGIGGTYGDQTWSRSVPWALAKNVGNNSAIAADAAYVTIEVAWTTLPVDPVPTPNTDGDALWSVVVVGLELA